MYISLEMGVEVSRKRRMHPEKLRYNYVKQDC
jgi:hypothetical protein